MGSDFIGFLTLCFLTMCHFVLSLAPSDQLSYIVAYKEDVLHLPISDLFNLTNPSTIPNCTLLPGSVGNLCDAETCSIQSNFESELPGEILFTKQVSLTSLFGIISSDQLQLLQVQLDPLGTSLHSRKLTPLSPYLSGEVAWNCLDLALSPSASQVFVVCMAGDRTRIQVITVDLNTPGSSTAQEVKATQLFAFEGVARVFVANLLGQNQLDKVLVLNIFCQTAGTIKQPASSQGWVYQIKFQPDRSKLESTGAFVDLKATGLFMVTNMFEVSGGIRVVGKKQGAQIDDMLQTSICVGFGQSSELPNCGRTEETRYPSSGGFVGKTYSGIYVEAIPQTSSQEGQHIIVRRCVIQGKTLAELDCSIQQVTIRMSTNISENSGIYSVEDSNYMVILKFFDSAQLELKQYAGASINGGTQVSGTGFVNPVDNKLIKLTSSGIQTQYILPAYYFLEIPKIQSDSNTIKINCTDPTSKNIQKIINLNILRHMGDLVMPSLFQGPPSLALEHGINSTVSLNPRFIIGNDLKMRVYAQPRQPTATVTYLQRDFVPTQEIVTNSFSPAQTTSEIVYAGNFGVSIGTQGDVSVFLCGVTDGYSAAVVNCYLIDNSSSKVEQGSTITKTSSNEQTAVFWIQNSRLQALLVQYDKTGALRTNLLNYSASDDFANNIIDGLVTVAVVDQQSKKVMISYAGGVIPDTPNPFDIYSTSLSMNGQDFCPVTVQFHRLYPNQLIIFSSCEAQNSAHIVVVEIPTSKYYQQTGPALNVVSSFAVATASENPSTMLCALGSELVIFSRDRHNSAIFLLQSYSMTSATRSIWSFGTTSDDMQIGTPVDFYCLQNSDSFATRSLKPDSNKPMLTIYWGNNQYQANSKIFRSTSYNLPSEDFTQQRIRAYETPDSVLLFRVIPSPTASQQSQLFTSYPSGRQISMSITLSNQSTLTPSGSTALNTIFDFSNAFHQITFTEPISLFSNISQTGVSISQTKLMLNHTSAQIDLSEVMNITGPLSSVELTGPQTLSLQSRVWNTTYLDVATNSNKEIIFSISKATSGDILVVKQTPQFGTVFWAKFYLVRNLNKSFDLDGTVNPIFHWDLDSTPEATVGAMTADGGVNLFYFMGDISQRTDSDSHLMILPFPDSKFSKVKVSQTGPTTFCVLSQDLVLHRLEILLFTAAGKQSMYDQSSVVLPDVTDFDCVNIDNLGNIAVYAISYADPTVLRLFSLKVVQGVVSYTQNTISVKYTRTAALSTVKAVRVNSTNYYLLLDTQILPYFFELPFLIANNTDPTSTTTYFKAYTGTDNCQRLTYTFDGSSDYILAMPSTGDWNGQGAYNIDVYRRSQDSVHNQLWYRVPFPPSQMITVGTGNQVATLFEVSPGVTRLVTLDSSKNSSQGLLKVSNLESRMSLVLVNSTTADLKNTTLKITGERGVITTSNLGDLVQIVEPPTPIPPTPIPPPTPPSPEPAKPKSRAWIHWVLITLVTLLILAGLYAFWRRKQDGQFGNDEELITHSGDQETIRKDNESTYDRMG